MEILAIRPHQGGGTLAHFDLALGDHIKMFNLKLVQGRSGLRVYAPSAFGSNCATFSPQLADQIVRAATRALGEVTHASAA